MSENNPILNESTQPSSSKTAAPVHKALNIIGLIAAWLIGLALVLVVGAVLTIKFAAPSMAMNYVSQKTGFAVKAKQFDLNLLPGQVILKDFVIENPTSFGGGAFINIPTLNLDVVPSSFAKEPYQIEDITLHLAELNLVTDANGQRNVEVFARALQPATEQKPTQEQPAKPAPQVLINHLLLQVDSVRLVDNRYTPAKVTSIDVAFKLERNNVTDLQALQAELSKKAISLALKKAGPAILNELGGTGITTVGQASRFTTQTLDKSASATSAAADKAAQKISNTSKNLKNLIQGLKE